MTLPSGFLAAGSPAAAPPSPQRTLAAAAAVLAVLLGGASTPACLTPAQPSARPWRRSSCCHCATSEGSQLSVVGLVRNPAAAPALERVSAVVLLFDQGGAFVTSAESPSMPAG